MMTQDPLSYLGRLVAGSPSASSPVVAVAAAVVGPTPPSTAATPPTSSASFVETVSRQQRAEGVARLSSLVLRLFNETFLSLPIVDCYNLTQLRPTWNQQQGNIKQDNVYDACFINWSQAKLVQNSVSTSSEIQGDQEQASEVFLSNLVEGHQPVRLVGTPHNLINSEPAPNGTLSGHQIDYELVKRAYLSVSSLLSVCGIFINLFIILIIIFNTRQKRPAARSNNIGKNNLLLIQLTVTGILLASYVLIDNINIQNQTDDPVTAKYQVSRLATFGLQHHFCNTNTNPSPLLTFLPPTPFHWHPLQCTNQLLGDQLISRLKTSSDRLIEDNQGSNEEEEEEEEDLEFISGSSTREPPALMLKFHKQQHQTRPNQTGSKRLSSWFLGFNSQDSTGTRSSVQVDLSDFLDSIFVVETNCLYWDNQRDQGIQGGRLKKSLPAEAEPKEPDREYNDSDSEFEEVKPSGNETRYKSIRLFLSQLHPLLVNVIGSVYIWTVAALAYDRYCAIAHPLQYLRSIHTSRTRTFFLLSWAISLGLNIFLPISTRQVILERENQLAQRATGGQNHYIISQWYSWIIDNIGQDLYEQTTAKEQTSASTGAKFLASIHQYNNHEIVRECLFSMPLMSPGPSPSSSPEAPKVNSGGGANFVPINRFERVWSRSRAIMRAARARSGLADFQAQIGRATKMKSDLVSELASILVESSSKIAWLQNNPDKFSERLKSEIENKSISEAKGGGGSGGDNDDDENSYIARLIIYSLLGFVIIILVPLLIITICNIRIYRIVKVHERRLSISSASNMAANNHLCQQRNCSLEEEDEEAAEVQVKARELAPGGVVSRLRSKLRRLGSLRRVPPPNVATRHELYAEPSPVVGAAGRAKETPRALKTPTKSESDTVSDQHCIVNRSRQTRIVRQDSYRLLDENQLRDTTQANGASSTSTPTSASTSPQSNLRIKRKISDHVLTIDFNRDSVASQQQLDGDGLLLTDGETCSALNSPSATGGQNFNNNNNGGDYKYESGGIFNQLKMAGLSFAGIAIQKRDSEATIFHKTALLKSSSCSLANLSTMNWSGAGPNGLTSSLNRPCMEQQRKSYVSLDAPTCRQLDQEPAIGGGCRPFKYITRLLEDDGGPHLQAQQQQHNHQHQHHHHQHHQSGRLPPTLGTKSATFNIVIWLIITMLIFTLPHYVLVTMDHIMKLNSSDNLQNYLKLIRKVDLDIYQQHLRRLVQLIFSIESSSAERKPSLDQLVLQIQRSNLSSSPADDSSFLKMSSIWLSCLCRVLFLSMVPLNGCLYGISSRSLRTTLRMILKRYISKKQAFIEIDQRQRSISSDRSRDSSFINQLPLYYGHQVAQNGHNNSSSACLSCNYRSPDSRERSNRRGSSFSVNQGSHHCRHQQHKFCNNSPNDSGRESENDDRLRNFQEKRSDQNNNNTIRFLIGDQSIHDLFNETHQKPTPAPLQPKRYKLPNWPLPCRGNESQSLSTGSSIKSLMSASINSSISLACSIIDEKIYSEQVLNGARSKSPKESLDGKRKHSQCSTLAGESGNLALDSGVQVSPDSMSASIESPATLGDAKRKSDAIESFDGARGEFKCFITPAEQKLVDIEGLENSKRMTAELDETSSCFWGQIRHNWTKILLDASTRLLSLGLKEQKEKTGGVNGGGGGGNQGGWPWKIQIEANHAQDLECRTSLLRRNSLDSPKSSLLSPRHKHQRYKCRDRRLGLLRSSLTISSLGLSPSSGRDDSSMPPTCCYQCSRHHHFLAHKRGSSVSLNQSPTYLKPPSFLKLHFDPSNPDQGYSVASALSPIKECSSNHSFASSQSSLGAAATNPQNKAAAQWNRIP